MCEGRKCVDKPEKQKEVKEETHGCQCHTTEEKHSCCCDEVGE